MSLPSESAAGKIFRKGTVFLKGRDRTYAWAWHKLRTRGFTLLDQYNTYLIAAYLPDNALFWGACDGVSKAHMVQTRKKTYREHPEFCSADQLPQIQQTVHLELLTSPTITRVIVSNAMWDRIDTLLFALEQRLSEHEFSEDASNRPDVDW